ncbi:MAG: hypothetical protein DRO39_01480 [Thermoprotei archaeon]|nr:MAG: hypothetical protein DRO39_01480 [Thermoprotei archaeon]
MGSRRYIVAIDRSGCYRLEVFGITATPIDAQSVLISYSNFFKHMRKLGSQKGCMYPRCSG